MSAATAAAVRDNMPDPLLNPKCRAYVGEDGPVQLATMRRIDKTVIWPQIGPNDSLFVPLRAAAAQDVASCLIRSVSTTPTNPRRAARATTRTCPTAPGRAGW